MTINLELTEAELKELVHKELARRLGDISFEPKDVKIVVKTKQNWKAEWEEGAYKATLTKTV